MIKFLHSKETAVQFKVQLSSDINQYARAFLHIFNNVRNDKDLYKIENSSASNNIWVTASKDYIDATQRYLEQFGTVLEMIEVPLYVVEPDYLATTDDDYDKLFNAVFVFDDDC